MTIMDRGLRPKKWTYIGEMEWALSMVNSCNRDRNPNRQAQVHAATQYGLAIARARRGCAIPDRPDLDKTS